MPLPIGTQAPNFTVKDTHGQDISLSDFAGKTVILYFYPKDDTPGCTKQAQGFRDFHKEYEDKDVVILGVSRDDEASHKAFTEKYNLPFQLLADINGTIIKAYDVDGGNYAKRVTYVIDSQGKIVDVDTNVNTTSHAQDVLAKIK